MEMEQMELGCRGHVPHWTLLFVMIFIPLPDQCTPIQSNHVPIPATLEIGGVPDRSQPGITTSSRMGTSLSFVLDISDSMYDDWEQVLRGAKEILTTVMANRDQPIYNFGLVPFFDPDIGPATITTDPDKFVEKLRNVYVSGGGDCPEASIGAILQALEMSLPGSFIYVFTDARSKDYHLVNEVLKTIQEKESQVVFVMTGDCGNHSHPGFKAYEQIAATSSGQVFLLNKSDVDEVLKFVEISLQSRKVNLIGTNHDSKAIISHRLPIDSRLNQITLAISGTNPFLELHDPTGRPVSVGDPGVEKQLDLDNVYILSIKNPKPGLWYLRAGSSDVHSVRVTGLSQLDFSYGFSRKPTMNINMTSHRALVGLVYNILIEGKELHPAGIFRRLDFLDLQGNVIATYPLTEVDPMRALYIVSDIVSPEGFYYIRVSGVDSNGFEFQRITPTALESLKPDPPRVRMSPWTPGYYGSTSVITCAVESLIPFTLHWTRDGLVISEPVQYSESADATYEIHNSVTANEGFYGCNATNTEGSSRAETYLDITEAPPILDTPENVTVTPGDSAVLSCHVIFSAVEYNMTWDRPGSFVTLAIHNRVSQLQNGSLLIQNINLADAGRYRCIAANEGGPSYENVYLFVQEKPEVRISGGNLTFTRGQNFSMTCTARGFPVPHLTWLKDGRELPTIPGLIIGPDGELTFINASPEVHGHYTCIASNSAGVSGTLSTVLYTEKPIIDMPTHQQLATPGALSTYLHCPATGIPPPKFTWFKDEFDLSAMSFISVHSNGTLEILSVQIVDKGVYTCVATNTAGNDTAAITLDVGARPTILTIPADIGVQYGQNVTMTCLARGTPQPVISWRRVGGVPIDSSPRVTIQSNGNLVIRDINVEDAGTYVCEAINEHGRDEVSAQIRITGLVRPDIADSPDVSEKIGTTVTLPCTPILGNPPPTIHWYRDGLPIRHGTHYRVREDGSLRIHPLRRDDAGMYRCVASNVAGNDTLWTHVTVQVPPTINSTETSYTVVYRDSVELLCPATGFPRPTVAWFKNGVPISSNELNQYVTDQGSLVITFANEDDAGTYTCMVSNKAGSTDLEITLHVLSPPSITEQPLSPNLNVTVGSTIAINCEAEGLPPPTIHWLRDGNQLRSSGANYVIDSSGSLTLQRISVNDQGQYVCVASNIAGNSTKTIYLNVQVPPSIQESGPIDLTVLVGNSIDLSCEALGIPAPEVTWQKDGVQLRQNSQLIFLPSGSLRVQQADQMNTGTYMCVASNAAGSTSKVITLTVHTYPNVTNFQSVYIINQTQSVTLRCPATGYPPPTVTWTKDGMPISENDLDRSKYFIDESAGTLQIIDAKYVDSGTYECLVTNLAGGISKQITLTVNVPPTSDGEVDIRTLQVTQDQSISLQCDVISYPPPEFTWLKNGRRLPGDLRHVVRPDGTLALSSLRLIDSGTYTCIASNVAGSTNIIYRLQVISPPSIAPGLTQLTVESGRTIELSCEVDGIPTPQVQWHKQGIPLDVDNNPRINRLVAGSLRIQGVTEEDTGEYECYAFNAAGSASRLINLDVRVSPTILETPREYTVKVRFPVTLLCPVTGTPKPEITWLKNGQEIEDVRYYQTQEGSLRIASTVRDDDANFTCVAKNSAGTSYKDIRLTIYVPPYDLTIGDKMFDFFLNDRISLPCVIDSYPPPTIIWKKDGEELVIDGQNYVQEKHSLEIPRAKVSHSGVFECVATNIAGNITRSMIVHVMVTPRIGIGPSVIKAFVGDSITLPCEAVGIPAPVHTWEKAGRLLDLENGRIAQLFSGSLAIDNVTQSDAGTYLCLVQNDAGSDTKEIRVVVQVPPIIIQDRVERLERRINSEVKLDCKAYGVPVPEITWYKDGNKIQQYENGYTILTNGTLLISNLQPNDNGMYECWAMSESGNATLEISINTQMRPYIDGENTIFQPETVSVTQYGNVYLHCNVTVAHPQASIQWYRDGRIITSRGDQGIQVEMGGARLSIPLIQERDAGMYQCVATNGIGDSNKHFHVSVHVHPVITSLRYEQLIVSAGESVSIACDATGYPTPRIAWRFEDRPVSGQNPHYNIHSDGTLEIPSVFVWDQGRYMCVAKSVAGNATRVVDLRVMVRPTITQVQTSLTRIEGSSVILPCESAGVPEPSVTWEKDGMTLNPDDDPDMEMIFTGSLRLANVDASDAGLYRCIARNDAGQASIAMTFIVHTPPVPDPNLPSQITPRPFNDTIIPCKMTGNPKPRIRWFKNNLPVAVNRGKYRQLADGSLLIRSVHAMDSGRYTCVGENGVGVKSNSVDLVVPIPPRIPDSNTPTEYPISELMPIDLQCFITDAYPPPIIMWFKGRELLTDDDDGITIQNDVLHIDAIRIEDAGEYSCLAFNLAGNATKIWNIDVQTRPRVIGDSIIRVTVDQDSKILLPCAVEATPAPWIEWEKDGEILPSNVPSQENNGIVTMEIPDAKRSNSGIYKCYARNAAGNVSITFVVEVHVPPVIEDALKEVIAVGLGQSIIIPCRASGFPPPEISWQKNYQDIPKNSLAMRVMVDGSLVINSTRVGDAGLYACLANSIAGFQMREVTLKVQEAPYIPRPQLTEETPHYGSAVLLTCPVTGIPQPDIMWMKDGVPVDPYEAEIFANGTLILRNVQGSDSGRYECIAVNEVGNFSIYIDVTVHVEPEIRNASSISLLSVLLNQRLDMVCEILNSVPPATIMWYKNGEPLPSQDPNYFTQADNQILTFTSAQTADSGTYECRATNNAGSTKKIFNVEVQVLPVIDGQPPGSGPIDPISVTVTQDKSIDLPCHASGNPQPTITWYKQGEPVTHNTPGVRVSRDGTVLSISRANVIHAGLFTCLATSSIGNATKVFAIMVHVPPEIDNAETLHNITVIQNNRVLLQCPTVAIPVARIKWFKDNRPLHTSQNVVIRDGGMALEIRDAQLLNNGRYHCVATNIVGESTKYFAVEVFIPPQPVNSNPNSTSVDTQKSVTLNCESEGYPLPTITWTKNGVFISPASSRYQISSGILHIPEVSVADMGFYECFVSNIAGNFTKSFTLEVLVAPTIEPIRGPISVSLGRPIRIPCTASGNPRPTITWQKNNQILTSDMGYTILDNGMLMIDSSEMSHAGRYICIARSKAGSSVLRVDLQVQVRPSIEGPAFSEHSVTEEDQITLSCEVSGIPPPVIRWIHNSQEITGNSFHHNILPSGSLQIPVVRREDQGLYVCFADNGVGIAQVQRYLEVQVPPSPNPRQPSEFFVNTGSVARLSCIIDGFPPPTITWEKDGQPIDTSRRLSVEDDGTLVIQQVQESDSGQYVCTAINAVGHVTRTVVLTIHVGPRFVRFPNDIELGIRDRLELVCEAQGNPPPQITWYINGTQTVSPPTVNGRSTYVIDSISKDDEGTYKCSAENTLGNRAASAVVIVRVPPTISVSADDKVVRVSDITVLDCASQGDPPPEVVWLKGNKIVTFNDRIQKAPNGSLIIYGTKPEDAGRYICRVFNRFGSDSSAAALEVQREPTFIMEPRNTTADQGSTIKLHCLVEGEPKPTISWLKDGFLIYPGQRIAILPNKTLVIVAAKREDTGRYVCQATNSMGPQSVGVNVIIRVHGQFSEWGQWGECSKTCGEGAHQRRTRQCNNPTPANNGRQCSGPSTDNRECILPMCPIDGRWSTWQPWGECSVTCGTGIRTRVRYCDNPPPQYNGRGCDGAPNQQADCIMRNCPVDGRYGPWTNWQPCSTTCGNGEQIRTRQCNNPPPQNFGRDCLGPAMHKRMCSERDCPVDGRWNEWSAWTTCTRSCNGGLRTRSRTCQAPQNNGRDCVGNNIEQDICNVERCPIHGNWSPWEAWTSCSASCDGGRQYRSRSCTRPAPQYNGRRCPGKSQEVRNCNQEECRRNGNWSPWSAWSPCSQTCGDSESIREHTCDNPAPANGGLPCVGPRTQVRKCNVPSCIGGPIEAVAQVSGNINGEEFGTTLLISNVSSETQGFSLVRARMYDIPASVGYALRYLISLISPIYWTSAYEVGDAINGYTLTKGNFERETEVVFGSGETMRITYRVTGVDADGVLKLSIIVTGEVPEFYPEDQVIFLPYDEDYIQTGPGEIFAQSRRVFTVNGIPIPYAWKHLISYDQSGVRMPFLVETLKARGLQGNFKPAEQMMEYGLQVSIHEGSPSNQCPQGFYFDQSGPFCRDEDECAQSGTCHHRCRNTPGSYECSCLRGYKLDRNNRCSDINECEAKPQLCSANQDCQNIPGSHLCLTSCRAGFRRLPTALTCSDVNECEDIDDLCDHQCQNTLGSYRCRCNRGFELQGGSRCVDINECERPDACVSRDQQCTNTLGSFTCITVCQNGFERAPNGSCADINECSNPIWNRCSRIQTCKNTYGGYTCLCPRGFRNDQQTNICLDINECRDSPCSYECRNTRGSYECICPEGMLRLSDRRTCVGRAVGPNEQLIVPTQRPEICSLGYQLVNNVCIDVDECQVGRQRGHSFCQGTCTNTEGSYTCSCPAGYRLSEDKTNCRDINECKSDRCGRDRMCFNTLGSYECVYVPCPRFYRRAELQTSEGTQFSCIKECPRNAPDCYDLEDSIRYKTLALARDYSDGWPTRDLFEMKVVNIRDGRPEENSYFTIIDERGSQEYCNCIMPFRIRRQNGKTLVATTSTLDKPKQYKLTVKASVYNEQNVFQYATRDIIFISVSAYPY
ncbi:hemicentin-1-like isoform X2 [Acanthaster planci]|uniref:Hemicentin-1-like isoform X2 n=1 Tax=Acanthaster planci TaxID=133434 RepID=A0A8B7Y048_ACAPL|nr:hemicentin-1-like isoform X2 [Acanthaster planci]